MDLSLPDFLPYAIKEAVWVFCKSKSKSVFVGSLLSVCLGCQQPSRAGVAFAKTVFTFLQQIVCCALLSAVLPWTEVTFYQPVAFNVPSGAHQANFQRTWKKAGKFPFRSWYGKEHGFGYWEVKTLAITRAVLQASLYCVTQHMWPQQGTWLHVNLCDLRLYSTNTACFFWRSKACSVPSAWPKGNSVWTVGVPCVTADEPLTPFRFLVLSDVLVAKLVSFSCLTLILSVPRASFFLSCAANPISEMIQTWKRTLFNKKHRLVSFPDYFTDVYSVATQTVSAAWFSERWIAVVRTGISCCGVWETR